MPTAMAASTSLLPFASSSRLPSAVRSRRRVHASASSASTPIRAEAAGSDEHEIARVSLAVSRREGIAAAVVSVVALSPLVPLAAAAILEADEDDELMEKVKKDRKKRIERQGVISSSNKETGYLQDVIYRLSKVGQAIEKNDLSSASSILGLRDANWIQDINTAFTKLTSSPEGRTEVDTFNSSLVTLISSVGKKDVESSKVAFLSSANALEKWVELSGLTGQLKGL